MNQFEGIKSVVLVLMAVPVTSAVIYLVNRGMSGALDAMVDLMEWYDGI